VTPAERRRIRVEGVVQGVGFRPFVFALATRLGLSGEVGNDSHGVFVEVEGDPAGLEAFAAALVEEAPPLAVVERVTSDAVEPMGSDAFRIVESRAEAERRTLVSPDTATCADCVRELFDPADRRHRYPFINCTNCGPRFTIVRDVPYDRPLTTMAGFEMCDACAREYEDAGDRRFHAQPVCCPSCGPRLRLVSSDADVPDEDALARAVTLVDAGAVVAVKGLGGYHLAADASSEDVVSRLRSRKHREDKPFAVMAAGPEEVRALCDVGAQEERLLTSVRRPIVLLRRRADGSVAPSVAPGNRSLGVMLPYTPLHHLLARDLGRPFVLTSGNVSDEPIAYLDDEAFERLAPIADAFLTHDRPIHIRTDDSVDQVAHGREVVLRRSRGYVPQPLSLPWAFERPVLACGAELKSTFCLGTRDRAFVSHHIGDLENYETFRSFRQGVEHFERLFDVRPEVVAHDLHPDYLSTRFASELEGVERVGVQHHHAHVVSCLADNGEAGPAIGVAFDGLGFGTDGTIWGGEFLVADLAGFTRAGHLEAVPMPGGAAAIREPWRMAAAYLAAALDDGDALTLDVRRRNEDRWAGVTDMARAGVNSPPTSSAGRLFDAVAAILGVRDAINYEGQAAIELEQRADPGEDGTYPVDVDDDEVLLVRGTDVVRHVVDDLRHGASVETVAARFHNAVRDAIVRVCDRIRDATSLSKVALSGGVFQNVLLLGRTIEALEGRRFRVLTHSRVPPNDGGISLGQATIAGALDRRAAPRP
jgi:hydrogenase maturation protein HypF